MAAWSLDERHTAALLGSADGLALLALLCNAAAKSNPNLYQFKALLVAAACRATPRNRWWVDSHRYALATPVGWCNRLNLWWESRFGWYLYATTMPIVFIETGLPFEGGTLQISFHFRPGDELPDVGNAPSANGRTWRKQRAQANAAHIAQQWIEKE
jgi:hypothetical protein